MDTNQMNICNTFFLPPHRLGTSLTGAGRSFVTLLLGCCALPASATTPANASPVSDGGMLQVMLGLGLVLAMIAGAAWLLRRFGGMARSSASAVKVIGGSAVGQRERVVLVEVGDTWLVVGVAPG